jgi:endonuclease-3
MLAFLPETCYNQNMNTNDKKIALALLEKLYFDAKPALEYSTAYELLVAVVLSAQCTDARVNLVTRELFKEHNTTKLYYIMNIIFKNIIYYNSL